MHYLQFNLSLSDPKPIFKQIVDVVRLQIATGELPAGTKLPSVRSLAMEKTISVNTVTKAYNILTAQGLVVSLPGKGLFVAERRQLLSEAEQHKKLDMAIKNFVSDVSDLHLEKSVIEQKVTDALAKIAPIPDPTSES